MKRTQCTKCKHKIRGNMKCTAFPNGIPHSVYFDGIKHDDILEGQEGLSIYEPLDRFVVDKNKEENPKLRRPIFDRSKIKEDISNKLFTEIQNNGYDIKPYEKAVFSVKRINRRLHQYSPIQVYTDRGVISLNKDRLVSSIYKKVSYLLKTTDCIYSDMKLTIFPNKNYEFKFIKAKGTSKEEKLEKYRIELKELNQNPLKDRILSDSKPRPKYRFRRKKMIDVTWVCCFFFLKSLDCLHMLVFFSG